MPNKGIRNAVYKRAGGKGQSSKFYNIYGKVVKPTDPTGFKGGQGWTAPKPQIGSMLSLGIMKQNKNAGGNNVCQPGPKPKKSVSSTSNDSTLTLIPNKVVFTLINPNDTETIGFIGVPGALNQGGFLSPQSIPGLPGTQIQEIFYNSISKNFVIIIDYASTGGGTPPSSATANFSTVSFINSNDGTGILYNTHALDPTGALGGSYTVVGARGIWDWQNSTGSLGSEAEKAFWDAAVGKNIKVAFAAANTTATTFETGTNNNDDCKCRGPLAQCPCRKGGC